MFARKAANNTKNKEQTQTSKLQKKKKNIVVCREHTNMIILLVFFTITLGDLYIILQFGPSFSRSDIFHPLLVGSSSSRSVIFHFCYLVRHFPVLHFQATQPNRQQERNASYLEICGYCFGVQVQSGEATRGLGSLNLLYTYFQGHFLDFYKPIKNLG